MRQSITYKLNTHLLWWGRCLRRWWATLSSPSAGSCTWGRAAWWVSYSRRRPATCTRTSAHPTWWDTCARCRTRSSCHRSNWSCWRNPPRGRRSSRSCSLPRAAEPPSSGPGRTWATPGPSCRVQSAGCPVQTASSAWMFCLCWTLVRDTTPSTRVVSSQIRGDAALQNNN